jgi:hypothetical protein
MAYVTEGSEITFMHMAFHFHFHVSSGGSLKNADHTLRLLYNYPVNYNAEGRRRLYFIFISSNSGVFRANFLISMLNETMHTLFVLPDGYCTPPLSADGSTARARARLL